MKLRAYQAVVVECMVSTSEPVGGGYESCEPDCAREHRRVKAKSLTRQAEQDAAEGRAPQRQRHCNAPRCTASHVSQSKQKDGYSLTSFGARCILPTC